MKFKFKLYLLLSVLALASVAASASSLLVLGGLEDTPIGGDADYQDLTFTITGATLHTSTGVFAPLLSVDTNDSGSPFWNHVSSDAPSDNIGNIWLASYTGVQYLANPGGTLDPDVWFSGGSTVTITGGQSADNNTLFECALGGAGCHQITGTYTFTPTGDWEVMAEVNGPGGAKYYSDPTWQQSSSFAFATDSDTVTPEPNAGLLAVAGLGFVLMARRWRVGSQSR